MSILRSLICLGFVLSATTTIKAQEPSPSNDVLIFTDNTPGTMLWAWPQMQVALQDGNTVHAVTTVAEFITQLPAKNWKRVIVAEKHTEGAPTYTAALTAYVENDGLALIFRWKEDPASPPSAGQLAAAPSGIHVWFAGATSWNYFQTKLNKDEASGSTSGYITKSFVEVGLDATQILAAASSGISIIEAGVYTAVAPDPRTCLEQLLIDIDKAIEEFEGTVTKCNLAHAPRPNDVPPFPGNPEELAKCIEEASKFLDQDTKKATFHYLLCLKIVGT